MRADYRVVLDACVLIPMPLADTLLRMAEAPRLYLPRWSQSIMDEVTRNLIAKWGMPIDKARRRAEEIRRHFPEALVEGFEPLTEVMTNDPGDRHVLAMAVRSHAELIVTYNRRHFPVGSVRPWEIEVQGPSAFLRGLYDLDVGLFVHKLHEQAEAIGATLERLLGSLSKNVPGFVEYFCEEQGIRFGTRENLPGFARQK
ncbi:conserved hypothetical protein [Candidatus Sulfotelmatobacter sp. SbA7]|nr:conserved hypothetical protein [Candidatus Sulfotelmatobacter sp. SbA7]